MAKRTLSSFVTILLCFVFFHCSGMLNVGGNWRGKMIQEEGPRGKDAYSMVFDLEQKDSLVSGTSRIEIPETEYYGVMRVEGLLKKDTLYFKEVKMLEDKPMAGSHWCMKEGKLIMKQEGHRLIGSWTAAPYCAPGEIDLLKVQ